MHTKTKLHFITHETACRSANEFLLISLFLLCLMMGGSAARAQSAACNGDINCLGGGRCLEGSCTCPLNQNCTWYQCPSGFTFETLSRFGTSVARCTRQVLYGFAVCNLGTGGRNYVARRGLDVCTDASGQRSFPAFCMNGNLFIDADGLRDNCADTLVRPANRATLTIQ